MTKTVDELLAEARARIERIGPADLDAWIEKGALIVDIRPASDRARDGEMPGAVVVERTVFEWRLDPASTHRIADVRGRDQPVVVFCNEGYSSSLAAATLRDLGFTHVADLDGGYRAWRSFYDRAHA